MSDSRYMAIFINFEGADRDILTRQLKMLKESGFDVKDPVKMTESYKKAMDMLQNMVSPIIKN